MGLRRGFNGLKPYMDKCRGEAVEVGMT